MLKLKEVKLILNKSIIEININSSVNLFEYQKIGPEILQSSKIERKMALLLMQKFKK